MGVEINGVEGFEGSGVGVVGVFGVGEENVDDVGNEVFVEGGMSVGCVVVFENGGSIEGGVDSYCFCVGVIGGGGSSWGGVMRDGMVDFWGGILCKGLEGRGEGMFCLEKGVSYGWM